MIEFVLALVLSAIDADTGELLAEEHRTITTQVETWPEALAACRIQGVEAGERLTRYWRRKYPNSFTNVKCDIIMGDPA